MAWQHCEPPSLSMSPSETVGAVSHDEPVIAA